MRRAHRALYRGEKFLRLVRARSDDVEDFRGRAVLLRAARAVAGGSRRSRGQRFWEGSAAAAADGIRSRGAEADLDLAGRQRGIKVVILRCLRSKPRRMTETQSSFEARRRRLALQDDELGKKECHCSKSEISRLASMTVKSFTGFRSS